MSEYDDPTMERGPVAARNRRLQIATEWDARYWVAARMVHSWQLRDCAVFRRGWSLQMTSADNKARSSLNLPEHDHDNGPVSDYVWWAQGRSEPVDVRLDSLAERFGSESREWLVDVVHAHLSDAGGGKAKYVPPTEYTYTMFRLDDPELMEVPLHD